MSMAGTTSRSHLIKPNLNSEYPVISHGLGVYLYDQLGRRYLDGCSGAVTANIGHGVQEIIQAMSQQAQQIAFVYRSQFTSEAAETLAAALASLAPGDLNWSFFVNSGSEATETAMKVAIQYWQERGFHGKNRVLARWTSYHGITLGALSMSGHVLRRRRFSPILQDLPVASSPYLYRSPYVGSLEDIGRRYAMEVEQAVHRIGPDNIAAFIAEPVVGAAGGALVPPNGYLQHIREICDRNDILFIADEVMTGMGRTGKMFAVQHWNIVPDMIVVGKGLSAGYTPIAATLISDRIIHTIRRGSGEIISGHTYSANPLSTATALAVVRYVTRNHLAEQAYLKGKYLMERLMDLADHTRIVGDVRGLGLLRGLEFVRDKKTKEPFPFSFQVTNRVVRQAFNNGLLVYAAAGAIDGQAGDAILVAPPLTIAESEIDELIDTLRDAIAQVEDQVLS